MAVNTQGVTPGANAIPEHWATEMSDASQEKTVACELVNRDYESQLAGGGDIIHITDSSNPAVRTKSEDTLATYSNIAESKNDLTINVHAYCGMLVEKMAEVQASVSLRSRYTTKMGYSLTAYIEGNATNGLVSLGANFSASVGVVGQDPTYDDLVEAVRKLDDRAVPEDGRYLLGPPSLRSALLKMDAFSKASSAGESVAKSALQKAMVGEVLGAGPVYLTSLWNNIPAAAGQSYAWFCHRDGVTLAIQANPEVHLQWDSLNIGWICMADVIYGFIERLIAPATLGGGTSDDKFNVAVHCS